MHRDLHLSPSEYTVPVEAKGGRGCGFGCRYPEKTAANPPPWLFPFMSYLPRSVAHSPRRWPLHLDGALNSRLAHPAPRKSSHPRPYAVPTTPSSLLHQVCTLQVPFESKWSLPYPIPATPSSWTAGHLFHSMSHPIITAYEKPQRRLSLTATC